MKLQKFLDAWKQFLEDIKYEKVLSYKKKYQEDEINNLIGNLNNINDFLIKYKFYKMNDDIHNVYKIIQSFYYGNTAIIAKYDIPEIQELIIEINSHTDNKHIEDQMNDWKNNFTNLKSYLSRNTNFPNRYVYLKKWCINNQINYKNKRFIMLRDDINKLWRDFINDEKYINNLKISLQNDVNKIYFE